MEGIDDILAEVSRHSRRDGRGVDDDDDSSYAYDRSLAPETRDLQALTRAWVAERAAPELRAYPHTLMERVMGRIRRQIEIVEMETGNVADPKANFRLIVLQTELERFKYLVRSFLRARIAKIDKHPLHILSTAAQQARLAAPELQYLLQHQALLHRHFLAAFLGDFPAPLRRLDDTAGGISMLDRPDLDTAVFVRVLRDGSSSGSGGGGGGGRRAQRQQGRGGLDADMLDDVYDDDLAAAGRGEDGGGEGGFLKRGDICVLRYSAVQEALQKGDVELI